MMMSRLYRQDIDPNNLISVGLTNPSFGIIRLFSGRTSEEVHQDREKFIEWYNKSAHGRDLQVPVSREGFYVRLTMEEDGSPNYDDCILYVVKETQS